MIRSAQLRSYIIQPALKAMGEYSIDIEEMLVAISAQETCGGTFLKQQEGSALGIFQMEPGTHDSIWKHYLSTHDGTIPNNIGLKILKACKYLAMPSADTMIYNLWYATIMARAFWLDVHEPIPAHNDLNAIWLQYKKYWNTPDGKATQEEFFNNYHKFTSQ